MNNEHRDSGKWVLGFLIAGVVGAGALYYLQAAESRKKPVLKKIGKTISNVGEILENYADQGNHTVMQQIEEKIPAGVDLMSTLSDWVDTAVTLWKQLKKG
jgi:hypothetical protein